ncbi:MAG: L-galactonate transporter [Pseudomonadota bacterium]|jgi:MFS family permease
MPQAEAGQIAGAGDRPARIPAYSWYALGVLTLVYMVNFVDRQILSILANDIKADLGLSDSQLGFLYGTAFAIFYALFGIPLGKLADSWNRTRLLAVGMALWSGMTALSGLARSGMSLSLARIGVGVGEATASPCAYSLIGDLFPSHRRATALSIYTSGLFVGSGVSLVIGAAIVKAWNAAFPAGGPFGLAGWQAAFMAVGLPGVGLALWVLSLREPLRGEIDGLPQTVGAQPWKEFAGQLMLIVPPFTVLGAARGGAMALLINLAGAVGFALGGWGLASATGGGGQFWFLAAGAYAVFSWACALRRDDRATFNLTWGTPAFMAIVFAYGAVSYVGYTLSYWAAPYGERTFAFDKVMTGWLIGAPAAAGGFIGVLAGGWLADRLLGRFAAGHLLVVLVGVLVPVPLVLLGYRTSDATTFLVCSFLLQAATSSALGAAGAATQALVLPRMRGTATAIFFLGATLIGLGIGPFMAGYVSEVSGSLRTGVQANLLIAPAGLLALIYAITRYGAAEQSRLRRAGEMVSSA